MIKLTRCITCADTISFDTATASYRRYCERCRDAKVKERDVAKCAARKQVAASLVESLNADCLDFRLSVFLNRAELRSRPAVAERLGISAEAVRQAEYSALRKILKAFAPERAEAA